MRKKKKEKKHEKKYKPYCLHHARITQLSAAQKAIKSLKGIRIFLPKDDSLSTEPFISRGRCYCNIDDLRLPPSHVNFSL